MRVNSLLNKKNFHSLFGKWKKKSSQLVDLFTFHSKNILFCLRKNRLFVQSQGFNDWKHSEQVTEHECSYDHRHYIPPLLHALVFSKVKSHYVELLRQADTEANTLVKSDPVGRGSRKFSKK
eukprot:Pompholyxophrys_punicea_v1_NODE_1237_length_845_cov_2.106329.p1 type:complete len:122 gc:universal NODE_1237_length_845_cov_2.106329:331-696(+)